jgi:A/G-specific adenine glycosylase
LSITNELIAWYKKHKRDLPWRNTTNPYFIWLSEVMLQQTRVKQGLPYYLKFIDTYPTVEDMASADESEILSLWQGLGYYSRARNMHHTAKIITEEYNGIFPSTYKEVLALKGIGEYTAAAILSFSFKQAYPVIDGNVFRVISRLYNISKPIDKPEGKREIEEAVHSIFDVHQPDIWNQAIMEFGAMQCTPRSPDCQYCVLSTKCLALANNTIDQLPVKQGKVKVVQVHHTYFNFMWQNKTYIVKRESGIWKNMYQFPLIEEAIETKDSILSAMNQLDTHQKLTIVSDYSTTHLLSHRKIIAKFYTIELENQPIFSKSNIFEIELDQLGTKYPTSVLTLNYWDQKKKHDK